MIRNHLSVWAEVTMDAPLTVYKCSHSRAEKDWKDQVSQPHMKRKSVFMKPEVYLLSDLH